MCEAGLNLVSLTLYEKRFSSSAYQSIRTLPIHNWNEVFRTGNLAYLIPDKPSIISIERAEIKSLFRLRILAKIWRNIMSEHIDAFGLSEGYMEVIELRTKIARNKIKRIQGDRGAQMFIDIDTLKLEKLINSRGETNAAFGDVSMIVRKYMGYDVNLRTTTVYEFFSAIEMMKRDIKNKPASERK